MHRLYFITFLFILQLTLWGQENKIKFTPLESGINTTDSEELGRWTIDGKSILFTRLSKDHLEVLTAHLDSLGHLINVEKMPAGTNYRGGGHAMSPDGKSIIFTICGDRMGLGSCDLYLSEFMDGVWTAPRNLGPAFNGARWEGQPAYGANGSAIFFASTRAGGYGGSDIWMVRQISTNIWSNPINLGPTINTANYEGSPFIHFDGRTMYFMRDGTEGYGGYDLYFSHLGTDGKWMQADNMGSSINSAADEGGLAIHPNGKTAMITRSTPGQQNDLFEFKIPDQYQSLPVQMLTVNITDEQTGKPVRAGIEVFDQNGTDTIKIAQLPDDKGNVTVTLDQNKSYGLVTYALGYMMYSTSLSKSKEPARKLNVKMIPVESAVNKTITLKNIFFETGSATLVSGATPELRILLQTLQTNPGMKIEIRGYTDDEGTDAENRRLSEMRAETVYAYLTRNGIERSRLSYKGFGETKPVDTNGTEEGKRQNRRTEFFILSYK